MIYIYYNKRIEYYVSWQTVDWIKVHYFLYNLKFLITRAKKMKNPNIRKWQIILTRSRANILFSILRITSGSDSIFFFLVKSR